MSTVETPEGPLGPDPIDDLLKLCPPSDGEVHDVGVIELAALRAGRLDGEEAEALEAQLAEDEEARRLMLAYSPTTDAALESWALAQMPATKRRWAVWAPAALALAAGLAFIIWTSLSHDPARSLPGYAMDAPQGMVSMVRGDDHAKKRRGLYLPSSTLKVIIRPDADLQGAPPTLTVLLAPEGGVLRRLDAGYTVDTGSSGAFRVSARLSDLLGEAYGRYTLYLTLSTEADAAADLIGEAPSAASMDARTTQWYPILIDYRRSAEEIERP